MESDWEVNCVGLNLKTQEGGMFKRWWRGESSIAARVVLLLLLLLCAIAVGRDSDARNAKECLSDAVASVRRGKVLWHQACVLCVILVIATALGGARTLLKIAGTVIFFPVIMLAGKLKKLLKRRPERVSNEEAERSQGGDRDVPPLARLIFLLVEGRDREHLVGDLEEEYCTIIVRACGRFRAWRWWWWQVFGIVTPYIWKRVRRVLGLEIVRGWRRR